MADFTSFNGYTAKDMTARADNTIQDALLVNNAGNGSNYRTQKKLDADLTALENKIALLKARIESLESG